MSNTYSFLNNTNKANNNNHIEIREDKSSWEFLTRSHQIFNDLHALRDRYPERFDLYTTKLQQELGLQPGQIFGYLARLKDLALEGCKSN